MTVWKNVRDHAGLHSGGGGLRVGRGPQFHGRPRGHSHFLLNFQPTNKVENYLLSLPSLLLFSNILVVLYLLGVAELEHSVLARRLLLESIQKELPFLA